MNLNNTLAKQIAQLPKVNSELVEILAVGNNTVDIITSTGSIYRHVSISGGATVGDKVQMQYIRNTPIVFGSGGLGKGGGGSSGSDSGVAVGGSSTVHALFSSTHTGTLDPTQAPWAFALDGSRTITGNVSLLTGATVDGIDVSVLGGRQVLTSGLGLSGGGVLYSADVTITLASSSAPGVATSILKTDTSGYLAIEGLSIGTTSPSPRQLRILGNSNSFLLGYDLSHSWNTAVGVGGDLTTTPTPSTANYIIAANAMVNGLGAGTATPVAQQIRMQGTANAFNQAYDSTHHWNSVVDLNGNLTMTPTPSTSDMIIMSDLGVGGTIPAGQTEQFRAAFDANNFLSIDVSSTGVTTITSTASSAVNGNIFLNPANRLGIGMSTAPGAKLEIREAGYKQFRMSYSGPIYGEFDVGAGGNLTVSTTGSDYVLDLQPTGGVAGLKFFRPYNGYDINLGSLTKKFLAIHAAELWVENLIAYDTTAIMGGRWNISNASQLTADWDATGTSSSTISYRASTSASQATGTTSWVITKPSGSVQDDIVLVTISLQNTYAITVPSGFISISGPTDWQGTRRVQFFYKILGASEGASWTFTIATATSGSWQASSFSGIDLVNPINASGFQFNNASTTSMSAPSISPTVTNTMLVLMGVANSSGTTTPPSGMTERADVANATAFNLSYLSSELLTSSGATGTRVATNSGSSYSVAGLVALKPGTVSSGSTSTTLKYNSFSIGDIGRLESNGKTEWVQVTSGPTGSASPYTYGFTRNLDGTGANDWAAGAAIVNTGQAGTGWFDVYSMWSSKGSPIEYIYNYGSSTYSSNLSFSQNFKLFNTGTISTGDIIYYGMGGGIWSSINHFVNAVSGSGFTGVLEYWNGSAWTALSSATTTHFADSTGVSTTLTTGGVPTSTGLIVHAWTASSQSGWAKNSINGVNAYWVRWRCTANTSYTASQTFKRVIRGSAQYGPTMVGWVRNSTTFNDFSERVAFGNLQGLYDYGKVTYGFAAGKFSGIWVSSDDANGFRIMTSSVVQGQWDTTGQITVGVNANSKSRVVISPAGKMSIINKSAGGVDSERFYVDAAGNARLVGDGTNYFDINGSTGVATFSGSVNIINGIIDGNTNIVYNSSFEVDTDANGMPDGWSLYNNTVGLQPSTISVQTSGGVDNGKFARQTWSVNNTSTKGWVADVGTIKNGFKTSTTYTVSWYGKASGTNIGQAMTLAWNTAPTTTVSILNPPLSSSWQRYAFRISWGGSVDPNMFITIANSSGTQGTLDMDQVQVELGSTLNPYKPTPTEILPGSVNWTTDISNRSINNSGQIVTAASPSGTGLFLGSTLMGFYTGSQWRTYMDNSGNFLFRAAPSTSVNASALWWDVSTNTLRGGYYAPAAGPSYGSFSTQWYSDSVTGTLNAGGGAVQLDLDGIEISDNGGINFSGNTSYGQLFTKFYSAAPFYGQVGLSLERAYAGSYLIGPNTTSYYSDSVGYSTIYFGSGTTSATQSGFIAVSASSVYEISLQFTSSGNLTGSSYLFQLDVSFYNSSGTFLSNLPYAIANEQTQSIPNWTQVNLSVGTPASCTQIKIQYQATSLGGAPSGSVTLSARRTKVRARTYYSGLSAISSGVLMNGSLLISNNYQANESLNNAFGEIANDTNAFKRLMLLGNKSSDGIRRRVGAWDEFIVNGELIVGDPASMWKSTGATLYYNATIGVTSIDYTPTIAKWNAFTGNFVNLLLNSSGVTSIGFHDSGNSVGAITYGAGVMTIGYDAGWGAARVLIPGIIGENWQDLSPYYATNWGNHATPWGKPQFKKVGDMVFLRGLVDRVTSNATSGTVILTLPSGYRPATNFDQLFNIRALVSGADASGRIDINSAGSMSIQFAVNTGGYVSLNGIYFSVV